MPPVALPGAKLLKSLTNGFGDVAADLVDVGFGNALKILEPGIKITGGSNVTGPAEAGKNKGFLLPAVTIGRMDAFFLKKELKSVPLSLKLSITGKMSISIWQKNFRKSRADF